MPRFGQIEESDVKIAPPDVKSNSDATPKPVSAEPETVGEPAPPEDLRKSPSGKYIKFTQKVTDRLKGSHRVVYAHEWRAAGVKDQGDVTWGPVNGYKVPVESLTQDARDRILREPGFSEVEGD